jgi:hypothetical protein
MLDRPKFWWRVLRLGAGNFNSTAGWFSLIVLILGLAAGVSVPQVFRVSHWLTAVILMAIVVVIILQGSYSAWAVTDAERKTALKSAKEKPSAPVHSPTFWAVNGGQVSGDIRNTYSASTYNASDGDGEQGGRMVVVGPGCGIDGLIDIEIGDRRPISFPDPFASTANERARLRKQLLSIANEVDSVMMKWHQTVNRQAVAKLMGIGPDEFDAKMPDIVAERSRIHDEITAQYNSEYRSTVIQVYGHARSIGFGDSEMERLWRTQHGVGASKIPAILRNVAAQIPN